MRVVVRQKLSHGRGRTGCRPLLACGPARAPFHQLLTSGHLGIGPQPGGILLMDVRVRTDPQRPPGVELGPSGQCPPRQLAGSGPIRWRSRAGRSGGRRGRRVLRRRGQQHPGTGRPIAQLRQPQRPRRYQAHRAIPATCVRRSAGDRKLRPRAGSGPGGRRARRRSPRAGRGRSSHRRRMCRCGPPKLRRLGRLGPLDPLRGLGRLDQLRQLGRLLPLGRLGPVVPLAGSGVPVAIFRRRGCHPMRFLPTHRGTDLPRGTSPPTHAAGSRRLGRCGAPNSQGADPEGQKPRDPGIASPCNLARCKPEDLASLKPENLAKPKRCDLVRPRPCDLAWCKPEDLAGVRLRDLGTSSPHGLARSRSGGRRHRRCRRWGRPRGSSMPRYVGRASGPMTGSSPMTGPSPMTGRDQTRSSDPTDTGRKRCAGQKKDAGRTTSAGRAQASELSRRYDPNSGCGPIKRRRPNTRHDPTTHHDLSTGLDPSMRRDRTMRRGPTTPRDPATPRDPRMGGDPPSSRNPTFRPDPTSPQGPTSPRGPTTPRDPPTCGDPTGRSRGREPGPPISCSTRPGRGPFRRRCVRAGRREPRGGGGSARWRCWWRWRWSAGLLVGR